MLNLNIFFETARESGFSSEYKEASYTYVSGYNMAFQIARVISRKAERMRDDMVNLSVVQFSDMKDDALDWYPYEDFPLAFDVGHTFDNEHETLGKKLGALNRGIENFVLLSHTQLDKLEEISESIAILKEAYGL